MSTRYVETFHTQNDLLEEIEALKAQGYSENDMYVMARNEEELTIIKGETDVDITSTDGNWLDKFKAFVKGDTPVREAFDRIGMEKEDAARYYDDVNNGAMLLYLDQDVEQPVKRDRSSLSGTGHSSSEESRTITGTNFSTDTVDSSTPRTGIRPDQDLGPMSDPRSGSNEMHRFAEDERRDETQDTVDVSKDAVQSGDSLVQNRQRPGFESGSSSSEHVHSDVDEKEHDSVHETEDDRNRHNHDADRHQNQEHREPSSEGLSKDHGNNADEDRRLIEEERVFRNKDRF